MVTETKKRWNLRPGGDIVLWIIAVVLAVVSLLVVYSSTGTSVVATSGNHFGVFIHQLGIVVMGLVVIYLVHKVNYQSYGRVVWAAYTIALVFAVLVYFIGEESGDAVRRMRIPLINFTFQPSDFLKVATVMVVARELARRQKTISTEPVVPPFTRSKWRKKNGRKILFDTTLPLFLPVVVSFAAIFPANLSTALILFGTCLVMMFIGRVRIRDLTKIILVFTLCGALAIGFLYTIGHPPKRMKTWVGRVERFFDIGDHSQMSDAERAREADLNYQVDQAKIAIAAGGLTGRGAGESIQRENLPLAESDYAYAFIIEEYGAIIGGLGVLLLYLWIFFRAILIFRKCGTAFPSMLVLGLGLLITLQALVNMMVSTNMMPSTGVTLPLISKGGSSELFLSLALGMMLGVSRQTQEQTLDTPRAETLLETPTRNS